MIVLDASVAVKWFFAEAGSDRAIELIEAANSNIAAPDIFVVEVCAALVRRANTDKSQTAGIRTLLDEFRGYIARDVVRLHRTDIAQANHAAHLAIELGHPLKDCLYLALATELNCPLVTADARFAQRAAPYANCIKLLDTDAA